MKIMMFLCLPIIGLFYPTIATIAAEAQSCKAQIVLSQTQVDAPIVMGNMIDVKQFKVTLVNTGTEPLLLVQPGDGSEIGLRTPSVSWSVLGVNAPVSQIFGTRDDDQINHLTAAEVFRVPVGESHEVSGFMPPVVVSGPGEFWITLHYVNDPGLKWTGIPIGIHDAATMRLVRTSSPCDIISNTLEIKAVPGALNNNGTQNQK